MNISLLSIRGRISLAIISILLLVLIPVTYVSYQITTIYSSNQYLENDVMQIGYLSGSLKNTLNQSFSYLSLYGLYHLDSNYQDLEYENEAIRLFGISQNITNDKRVDDLSYLGKIKSGNSYNVRKNLILNGLDFLENSNYLGVGSGQYSVYTSKGLIKHDVDTVLSPHSLIIELLSEYGILMFLFFVAIFIFLFILFVFAYLFLFLNLCHKYKPPTIVPKGKLNKRTIETGKANL